MAAEQVEQWRAVTDYSAYEVSNLGNVRRTFKNGKVKILKPKDNGKGYKQVGLYLKGNTKTFLVHRLVAFAFVELVAGKLTVDHKDRDKTNNSVENLRWADRFDQNRNRSTYRTDILETDPKLRRLIFKKERYEKNKETINARKLEKIQCECGASVGRSSISAHRKSQKHLKAMNEN